MALQLSDQHFSNMDGKVMTLALPKPVVFVMFKTMQCQICPKIIPMFERMAQQDQRLAWAIVDVGQYRSIIGMARTSTTPIKSVPTFILYVNGRPQLNYKGERTPQHIKAFLDQALQKIATKSFVPPRQNPAPQQPQPSHHVQHEDESTIQMPNNIIPKNTPWQSKQHY